MHTFVRLTILFLSIATGIAQSPLRVDGISIPWIRHFEDSTTSNAPATVRTVALTVLGHLRLADHARARIALAGCCAAVDVDAGAHRVDPAWAAAAIYWYLRATHDVDTARRHLPSISASLAKIGPSSCGELFADETMLVHGMLCVAGIEALIDRRAPSTISATNAWSTRAIQRWLWIEERAWQPGRVHFRPHLTAGAATLPEPADASVLSPAAMGMLVASDDHLTQHLRTVVERALTANWHDARELRFASPLAPALLLASATQLGDFAVRLDAWRRLAERPRDGATIPIDVAAAELDAALFAITGLRIATGAGVDEGWLRLRPWLPPGCERVLIRGLFAEGVRFDLDVEHRSGTLGTDEIDTGDEAPQQCQRLHVSIAIASAATSPVRLVLQGPSMQYVTSVEPGGSFERSLPIDGR